MLRNPLARILALCGIGFVISIALSMVDSVIYSRESYRESAVRAITEATAGPQTLIGPILVVPITDDYDRMVEDFQDGKKILRKQHQTVDNTIRVLPRQLDGVGTLAIEPRAYGLYKANVFDLTTTLAGNFELPDEPPKPVVRDAARSPSSDVVVTRTYGKPYLVVGVADTRGLSTEPRVLWQDTPLAIQRGTLLGGVAQGFHAVLPQPISWAKQGKAPTVDFKIDLRLIGTDSVSLVPVADQTSWRLSGNWQHPSFSGFLPATRSLTGQGFEANWRVSSLASSAQQTLRGMEFGKSDDPSLERFKVRLIDPVDVYQQTVRTAKYSFLFIVLTFGAFFLYEIGKALAIHPVQYLLIGFAQSMFFLLLLSLAEHIAFAWAYLAAASACTGLIAYYLATVLKGWKPAAMFSAGLALIYGCIYGLLRSEDYALLLGSGLLFVALAVAMIVTRKIDWFALSSKAGKDLGDRVKRDVQQATQVVTHKAQQLVPERPVAGDAQG